MANWCWCNWGPTHHWVTDACFLPVDAAAERLRLLAPFEATVEVCENTSWVGITFGEGILPSRRSGYIHISEKLEFRGTVLTIISKPTEEENDGQSN